MWDYALLSKMAKNFGGPEMFVVTIFKTDIVVGRLYERREEIIDGSVEIIESIALKIKELNNEKKIKKFKRELINGIEHYEKNEEQKQ